jgi:hypothetical protein
MAAGRYPWLLESDDDEPDTLRATALLESDTDGTAHVLLEIEDLGAPIGNRPMTMKTSSQRLEPQRRTPRISALLKLVRRH